MKTLITTTLAAALFIAGTAAAHDHDRNRDRDRQRSAPAPELAAIQHLGKAVRRLGLSEEQKEAVRAEFKGLKEQVRPIMEARRAAHRELRELVTTTPYDADAVADLAASQGKSATELTMITSGTVAAVLSVRSEVVPASTSDSDSDSPASVPTRRRSGNARRRRRRAPTLSL